MVHPLRNLLLSAVCLLTASIATWQQIQAVWTVDDTTSNEESQVFLSDTSQASSNQYDRLEAAFQIANSWENLDQRVDLLSSIALAYHERDEPEQAQRLFEQAATNARGALEPALYLAAIIRTHHQLGNVEAVRTTVRTAEALIVGQPA